MTNDEKKARADRLFAEARDVLADSDGRVKLRLANGMGVGYSTVKRWATTESAVPEYAFVVLDLLRRLKAAGAQFPPGFYDARRTRGD